MQNIQKLYDLEQKTSLGSNAVLLFLFLKEIKNEDSQITISDYDLAKILRLARQTIITTKKHLKKADGLIITPTREELRLIYYLTQQQIYISPKLPTTPQLKIVQTQKRKIQAIPLGKNLSNMYKHYKFTIKIYNPL